MRHWRFSPNGAVALSGLLFVLAFVFAWHYCNEYYPRYDAAEYLFNSQKIYLAFKNEGTFQGLVTAYTSRGRPVLHPVLLVPFLALSGGKILYAVAMASMAFLSVFYLFVYLIFRRTFSSWTATLASATLAMLPVVIHGATTPMSELPHLAAWSGVLYALYRSEELSNRKWSVIFGLMLSLAFCIRPIEALLLAAGPLLFLGVRGVRRAVISPLECLAILTLLALIGAALGFGVIREYRLPDWRANVGVVVFTVLCAASVFALEFRQKRLSGYYWAFAVCFITSVFWLFPFVADIYEWATAAEWGAVTREGQVPRWVNTLTFPLWAYGHLGRIGLLILLFGTGVAFTLLARSDRRSFVRKTYFPSMLWVLLVPPLLGSFSNNWDPRYYTPGTTLLAGVSLFLCLRVPRNYQLIGYGTVSLAFLACTLSFADITWGPITIRGNSTDYWNTRDRLRVPPYRKAEPLRSGYGRFREIVMSNADPKILKDGFKVSILQTVTHKDVDSTFYPVAMTLISREAGDNLYFETPSIPPGTTKEQLLSILEELEMTSRYILVGPPEGKGAYLGSHYFELAMLVLDYERKGKLSELALKKVGRFHVSDRFLNSYEILVLKPMFVPLF